MKLIRTNIQSVDTEVKLDLSFLDHRDDPVSVTIEPTTVDTLELAGIEGDVFINVGEGISFNINFNERIDEALPVLRSTIGAQNVSIIVATHRTQFGE